MSRRHYKGGAWPTLDFHKGAIVGGHPGRCRRAFALGWLGGMISMWLLKAMLGA